jgi:hypothetical protein
VSIFLISQFDFVEETQHVSCKEELLHIYIDLSLPKVKQNNIRLLQYILLDTFDDHTLTKHVLPPDEGEYNSEWNSVSPLPYRWQESLYRNSRPEILPERFL